MHVYLRSGEIINLNGVSNLPDVYYGQPRQSAGASLSPNGELLAVAGPVDEGGSGYISVISPSTGYPVAEGIRTRWAPAYRATYASPFDGLPLTWSPDSRYFLTNDDDMRLVARSACDGHVLTTLSIPNDEFPEHGFTNAAFTQDGTRLAAYRSTESWDEGQVSIWEVRPPQ